ncbi:amidohydrolase [Acidaminobacter sp. JC074]|uniref:amidohydrolase n=1 Tax=Acidaminobacter sp. JC074 TaxID=2530199 RepID=UPI001F0E24AC|nr:amidohydrolase [Acidaminobacter sp. JC074]
MINEIRNHIEENKEAILKVSHDIHERPELGFEEFESSKIMCDYLESLGYEVKRGIGKFETAFKASLGSKGPKIAVLAEYDALPGIGHGCGHNVISAVAAGLAAGLGPLIKSNQLKGQVVVIGTPAEETGGGKIELLKLGVFEDVDYVMMVHPGSTNMVKRGGTALVELQVAFQGKRAHSSVPENGINALKALIQIFTGIDAMQGEFPLGININGIIKEGGQASNIIPEKASAEFIIRGLRLMDLKQVKDKIKRVIQAAEVMTGAKATYDFKLPYAERYPNPVMADKFKEIMESLGQEVVYPEPQMKLGSSDIGNVSLYKPTIHPYIKIGDNLKAHTLMFTEASKSSCADDMILTAAKALAELAVKLINDSGLRQEVNDAFKAQVPDYSDFKFEEV